MKKKHIYHWLSRFKRYDGMNWQSTYNFNKVEHFRMMGYVTILCPYQHNANQGRTLI